MTGEQQIQPGETDEFAWHATGNPLPEAVDVAIIGGGIIGSSTAYFLAQSGVSVALFEKGRIAGEQSGRNWGWVRQQCRSPVELPLMMQSLRLWKELPAQLGEDVGFRQGGTLYLAENAKGARSARRVACRRARACARHEDPRRSRTQGRIRRRRALVRRALHRERWPRRAVEGRTRHRPRRGTRWRANPGPHGGARHRDRGRARLGRHHGTWPSRDARGRLRGGCLDPAILRLDRHPRAAAAGPRNGRTHGAGTG